MDVRLKKAVAERHSWQGRDALIIWMLRSLGIRETHMEVLPEVHLRTVRSISAIKESVLMLEFPHILDEVPWMR